MQTFVVSIVVMIVAGWAATGTPLRGDQALFTLYAERMSHGEVLYRDCWDVTNLGVYWFYQAAGTCFGFTEDGIHLFEWLWFTALVLSVQQFIRFRCGGESIMPALFIGGWYYCTATADPSHLTKAEGLVAFPLFVAVMALTRGLERNRWGWCFLAGCAGGIVVLFKFAFALCLLAGWLPALILLLKRRQILSLLTMVGGFAVPLGLAVLSFARQGSLNIAFETLFVTPREMLTVAEPAGMTRLMLSVRWFVETGTPLIVLAAAGLLATPKWWRDPFLLGYVLILPASVVVILIQKWSWWTYHFQLLSLPLAVIACVTWLNLSSLMATKFQTRRWMLLLPLLLLPVLLHGASSYLRLLQHRMGLTRLDRISARFDAGNAYRIANSETAWLGDAPDGAMFIAGDPLFHTLSHRPMATSLHGWSLELFTPTLWQRLLRELKANPPRHIYINRGELGYESLITAKSPELLTWIREHYRINRESKKRRLARMASLKPGTLTLSP
ncbi:hypothetical protein BH11PLA2_BH11PLA2_18790 [soil metagenome]